MLLVEACPALRLPLPPSTSAVLCGVPVTLLVVEGLGVGQEQDEVAEGLGLGAELKRTRKARSLKLAMAQ